MSGLLLKDWYVARRSCRFYFGVIVLMCLMSVLVETGMTYLIYPALFAGMIPVFVLSVEEKTGWESLAATLPVSRGTVVAEKYVASLVSIAAAAAFMGLLWAARLLLAGGRINGLDWYGLGRILVQLVCFGCVYPILTLPAMFRFGVEKGRFILIAVCAVAVAALVGLQSKASEISSADIAAAMGWHVPVMLLITAALYVLSWLLAARLYAGREL